MKIEPLFAYFRKLILTKHVTIDFGSKGSSKGWFIANKGLVVQKVVCELDKRFKDLIEYFVAQIN